MQIPESLTDADILRLLPALEKWDKHVAVDVAFILQAGHLHWELAQKCKIDFVEEEYDEEGELSNPNAVGKPSRVEFPSEVVTKILGPVLEDVPCQNLKTGQPCTRTLGRMRAAIIISTEEKLRDVQDKERE